MKWKLIKGYETPKGKFYPQVMEFCSGSDEYVVGTKDGEGCEYFDKEFVKVNKEWFEMKYTKGWSSPATAVNDVRYWVLSYENEMALTTYHKYEDMEDGEYFFDYEDSSSYRMDEVLAIKIVEVPKKPSL